MAYNIKVNYDFKEPYWFICEALGTSLVYVQSAYI